MKKTEQVETEYCDFCEANPARYNHCFRCDKAICYDCRKTQAHEYSHGINVGGSGDGLYCNECDGVLRKSGADPLHRAYLVVESLKNEQRGFYEHFEVRRSAAEKAVLLLVEQRRSQQRNERQS